MPDPLEAGWVRRAGGPACARYVRSVAGNPDFVGCHRFQYVDQTPTGRLPDGENHHVGFVVDLPHRELVTAARRANLDAIDARSAR